MSLEEITNITNIEHFIGKDVEITTVGDDFVIGTVEKIFDGFMQVGAIEITPNDFNTIIEKGLTWVNIKNIVAIKIFKPLENPDYFSQDIASQETEGDAPEENTTDEISDGYTTYK
jgi:hypothetical protein